MLDSHMEQIAKELEIEEPLNTKEPGVYALPLDEGVTVIIAPLEQLGVSLRCDFAPYPDNAQEDLFKELLQANLFGQGTQGATIGLNTEKKMLTLSYDFPYDTDYQLFNQILEDFINSVDFWRTETKTITK